jgi:hypothetical protein
LTQEDAEIRESERRGMLIAWTVMVVAVFLASLHRFGELGLQRPQSLGEWLGWLIPVSPLIPLVLWLRARKQLREFLSKDKSVEKPE